MRINTAHRDLRRAGCSETGTSGSGSGPGKPTDGDADRAPRADFHHSFLNLPHGIEEMLAEARAYRLSVTLAHQNLAQFPPAMRDAVAANARSKVFFTVSPRDAHDLAPMTWPNLTEHDLANLGAYQAAARLIVANTETPAFTLTTRPLAEAAPGRAELLRQAARVNAETTRRLPHLPDPRRDGAANPESIGPPPARPPS